MNHVQLKAAIASWMNRTDLTATIPTFVQLAEARLARDLRVRQMLTRTTLTVTTGNSTVALPSDFLELVAVSGTNGWRNISPTVMEDKRTTGTPEQFYTVFGTTLTLPKAVESDVTLTLAYYAKFTALSADGDTNWLLTDYPGAYMWGAMSEAGTFLRDDAAVAQFEAKYKLEVSAVKEADNNARFAGAELLSGDHP